MGRERALRGWKAGQRPGDAHALGGLIQSHTAKTEKLQGIPEDRIAKWWIRPYQARQTNIKIALCKE